MLTEEGVSREPIRRGRRCDTIIIICGGRGRAGAGKRGKTVLYCCYLLYTEEGAELELVGGGRQCCVIVIIYTEEGAGREPIGGGRR